MRSNLCFDADRHTTLRTVRSLTFGVRRFRSHQIAIHIVVTNTAGWRLAATASNLLLRLAEVAFKQPAKRQVFIEIRPMKSKRRNLDVVQLLRRAARQPWILRDGKTYLPAA